MILDCCTAAVELRGTAQFNATTITSYSLSLFPLPFAVMQLPSPSSPPPPQLSAEQIVFCGPLLPFPLSPLFFAAWRQNSAPSSLKSANVHLTLQKEEPKCRRQDFLLLLFLFLASPVFFANKNHLENKKCTNNIYRKRSVLTPKSVCTDAHFLLFPGAARCTTGATRRRRAWACSTTCLTSSGSSGSATGERHTAVRLKNMFDHSRVRTGDLLRVKQT